MATVVSEHDLPGITLDLVKTLLRDYGTRDFTIRLWNGSIIKNSNDSPNRFTIELRSPRAVTALLKSRDLLTLGEAFLHGDIEVEGDLIAAFKLAYYLIDLDASLFQRLALTHTIARFPNMLRNGIPGIGARLYGPREAKERVREAISYHYDLPVEFWKLWLDDQLQYTCAYYNTPTENINVAQLAKLDYVCKKLALKPGERLLDIGCGWLGLLTHAVMRYDVEGVGITLSKSQAEYAQQQIKHHQLEKRCRVIVCDFREIDTSQRFHKIAGIGVIEHIGESLQPEYFRTVYELLEDSGLFLNQGICRSQTMQSRGGSAFLHNHVFPDHDIVPIHRTIRIAEENGFEITDIENLRPHYALTLRAWLNNFENNSTAIKAITSPDMYRAFRVYLAGMANDFDRGGLKLYQSLMTKFKPTGSDERLTRAEWYLRKS